MPYPLSPFRDNFETVLIGNDSSHSSSLLISNLKDTFKWLCEMPKVISIRINALKEEGDTKLLDSLKTHFESIPRTVASPLHLCIHELIEDVIVIKHEFTQIDLIHQNEIIVDSNCGAAILRGADIFAPGVLGMLKGTQVNDKVSIYVDFQRKCKKGFAKILNEPKCFIGNGIVKMSRREIFCENAKPRGVAIEVTESISGCPRGFACRIPNGFGLLQNLPSVICVHSLDPQPKEDILDMCAAPGHKTSHIAALKKNRGILVALDKTPGKIAILKEHCALFDAKANIFLQDSTTAFDETSTNKPWDCPPYPANTFDRILLDAPCSALGKRPQFQTNINDKVLNSYVPLQRKLFRNAVNLLKPRGLLVYSTCTITIRENEGIVAWALKEFDNVSLVRSKLHMGSKGLDGTSLTSEELELVQRFGPETNVDSVGFFIACFTKL